MAMRGSFARYIVLAVAVCVQPLSLHAAPSPTSRVYHSTLQAENRPSSVPLKLAAKHADSSVLAHHPRQTADERSVKRPSLRAAAPPAHLQQTHSGGPISDATAPFPTTDEGAAKCNRPKGSRICDPNSYLSSEDADAIEKQIKDTFGKWQIPKEEDPNEGHLQVGVYIVKEMERSWWAGPDSKEFSVQLYRRWQLGYPSEIANGLLIFLSIEDRKASIRTGDTARSLIEDWDASHIISAMGDDLRAGRITAAIKLALTDLLASAKGEYEVQLSTWEIFTYICLGLLICYYIWGLCVAPLVVVLYKKYLERKYTAEYEQVAEQLKRIDQARGEAKEKARMGPDPALKWQCPVCLDEFAYSQQQYGTETTGRVLGCGHRFCEGCIGKWVDDSDPEHSRGCPVCRMTVASIEGFTEEEAKERKELQYKLQRLHERHPDVVSEQLLRDWSLQTWDSNRRCDSYSYHDHFSSNWSLSDTIAVSAGFVALGYWTTMPSGGFGGGGFSGGGGADGGW